MTKDQLLAHLDKQFVQLSQDYPDVSLSVLKVAFLKGYITGTQEAIDSYKNVIPQQTPDPDHCECGEKLVEYENYLPDVDRTETLLQCPVCK